MRFFKHFSNAKNSDSLEQLIEEFGFEGYGRYWRLLEILSERFDGESTTFKFHNRVLRDSLRFRTRLKLRSYMLAIGLQDGYKVIETDSHYIIEAPILLDLQDRDFKKSRKIRAESAPKIKREDKDKDKDKDARKADAIVFDFEAIYNAYP